MHTTEHPFLGRPDVRFGSEADMCGAKGHVRFTPDSDIKCDIMECPLWAKSGHQAYAHRRPLEIRFGFVYIGGMLSRNSRGRPLNAPPAFIHPCQPTVAKQPPTGPGWAHELKHDGYRLQIHVRDGRVGLFTMNGANWSKRYPRIVEEAARIKGSAVMDAEVVCLVKKGVADFDMLHGRTSDHLAVACAFDLLMHDGADLRRRPFRERKLALSKLLIRSRDGIQYVEHTEGHAEKLFEAVCDLGLEGIVSKRLTSVYRSGRSKTWIKVKNPEAPAATRVIDGTF